MLLNVLLKPHGHELFYLIEKTVSVFTTKQNVV